MRSVTIVTPSYCQLEFLRACVASVEIQSYPSVEHLVLDGGSIDGTIDYLATNPGRVSWWRSHPDGGQSQALNEGIARASGDWIGWQNSDDFYFPGAFWLVSQAIEQHPDVGVVVGDTAVVDLHGVKEYLVGVSPVPARLWLRGHWPYNQGIFIRRDILLKAGPVDEALHIHMDTDLFARIAAMEPAVVYVNCPLGAFRKHVGTKTESPELLDRRTSERALLKRRYGARMWPESGVERFLHRVSHHAWAARTWPLRALLGRVGERALRQPRSTFVRRLP